MGRVRSKVNRSDARRETTDRGNGIRSLAFIGGVDWDSREIRMRERENETDGLLKGVALRTRRRSRTFVIPMLSSPPFGDADTTLP